ncbi:2-hydroxyacid dehydrogenase [Pseudoroseomonas cervicalis]|uniref:4-phosphoerythronate dehydrogenase n=1 Tax=Pseudoroseomonas cervicalis ATCC 49957 TaxID=525371 RepID=D5RR31_9PROT|nr:D-glycerate dehydrogenase [Pseudoroseomonas cervicalis]EFH10234.1 4-phosphoerythronate dehydrogenase [Pseudoroseomonas cervicalis ATCC 49957]
MQEPVPTRPRLVSVRRLPPAIAARIRQEYDAIQAEAHDLTQEQALAALRQSGAQALLVSSSFRMDAAFIAALPPEVRIAATCSVGFDHVDVAAAQARGLIVTNTPDVLTGCTADLAFALLLAAARRLPEADRVLREDRWGPRGMGDFLGVRVWGKTLGIIGMGRIGRAVARRARGFDMRVLYHDVAALPPALEEGAHHVAQLEEMLPRCDMVSLHCPLLPATRHILNRETLALLPRGAVVVNAARGGLVEEDALIAALQSGQLAAAGLDVFEGEPRFDKRLAGLPNVALAPHIGSGTVETRDAMGHRSLDNIAAVLAGRPPLDPIWS